MSESLEALRNEMFETMQRMRQRRSTPPLPPGITRGEINALMMLSMMEARDEIARPGMLAACSHATPGAVSQTLKSLEEKGLIVRRRGEGDLSLRHDFPDRCGPRVRKRRPPSA